MKNAVCMMGLPLIAVLCAALGAPERLAAANPEPAPSKECRLIINWDQQNMWALQLTYAHRRKTPDPVAVKAMLEDIVDEHAKAKVDRIVHCVFAMPRGTVGPGFRTFQRQPDTGYRVYEDTETGIRQLEASGQDLMRILLDRSHQKGMQFLAGLRMNDRHGGSATQPFSREHPEWRLEGFSGGGMDYKYEGVRKAVLAFTEEFLDRYDVDGVELDWMRWCHVFKPSEAVENAPLLTGFMVEMRKILDRAARKRGRRNLILGVRIPQTLEECRSLGFDVKTWIHRGLVDYICPSDFFHTDFNIRTEDFVRLTKGTRCKVFPSIHPWIARGNDFNVHSEKSYRAAANNYYAYGADGISAYNYQYHWRTDIGPETEWPRVMSYLTGLRNRKDVAAGERRYMYHPIWPNGAPTGARNYDLIRLNRTDATPRGSLRLRVAENLKSATMEFKVTGMVESDEIEVEWNGRMIPAGRISRVYVPGGQSAKQGRALPAFYLYRMLLSAPPARFGDNELEVRLKKSAGQETLVVQEMEIAVPGGRSAELPRTRGALSAPAVPVL
ncbi:MAG: hypothetical protein ACKV22_22275 [Bryobacteraceae bacterium]